MTRRSELEHAIFEDPSAIDPRMVYADWLQSEGLAIGEWAALQLAVQQHPDDLALRLLALAHLHEHARDVLGEGSEILDGLYLGWHGGFIDEIRIHGTDRMTRGRDGAARLDELLAHPIARFVRTISIGGFTDAELPGGVDALLEVLRRRAPRLVRALVLCDAWDGTTSSPPDLDVSADAIAGVLAALPALTRLGISRLPLDAFPYARLPPTLEELVIVGAADRLRLEAASLPRLTELALVGPRAGAHTRPLRLPPLPALRRLRVVGAGDQIARLLAACERAGALSNLELLDVSHNKLDARAQRVVDAVEQTGCRIQRLRMDVLPDGRAHHICRGHDPVGESWLIDRLAEAGRDGLATTPHAGIGLYNASCHHSEVENFETALVAAHGAMAFPDAAFGGWGWGMVSWVHEQLGQPAEAEHAAREGLLRFPRSASFHGMLLRALRSRGRSVLAEALVPEALHAVTSKTRPEEAQACLLEIVLALDDRGAHAQAIATAKRKQPLVPFDAHLHEALALAHLAIGDVDVARAHLAEADAAPGDPDCIGSVARAAFAIATGDAEAAIAALVEAKRLRFRPWAPLARDRRFAKLQGDARFAALFG